MQGTLDCLLCRDDPAGQQDANKAICNLYAALRSPGTLIIVSHSPPDLRLPLLKCCAWESIKVRVVGGWGVHGWRLSSAAVCVHR